MILLLFLTSIAAADPTAITVKKGEIAPFNGTLLNQDAVAEILSKEEALSKRCEADKRLLLDTTSAKFEASIELTSSKLQSCEASLNNVSAEYEGLQLKYNRSQAMKPYVAGMGFVFGVGITILIAGAIQ